VGSVALGMLDDKSLPALVVVSVLGQLVSLPIFFLAKRASQHQWLRGLVGPITLCIWMAVPER
jgi:hypothetical protein